MTKLTPEQIISIAEKTTSRGSEEISDWRLEEEETQRNDILNRVRERVRTVMEVENMSPHERAAYVIEKEDELAAMREMINRLLLDPLTGLNVRRYYEETVPRMIEDRLKQAGIIRELSGFREGVEGEGPEIAMLMIDADHFKNINDTFGHSAGDFVLKEIGEIINRLFRKRDIKARYGG